MFLEKVLLDHYRNYGRREIEFSPRTNLIIGPNASGKTNLIEAVYLLASGDSFRAAKIAETVNRQVQVAHVKGWLNLKEAVDKLAVALTRGEVNGKKVRRRKFSYNDNSRRKSDFVGRMKAVLFRPENLDIIIGSPSGRRSFLDEVLRQADREYYRADLSYRKGLRSRNKVLEQIREGETQEKALFFWDRLLIENGEKIIRHRQTLTSFFNEQESVFGDLQIGYQPSRVSPARFEEKRSAEIGAGRTLIGPHRDDFAVLESGRNLGVYGSRGEQRLGVLWLKLGQLAYLEETKDQQVILLLDDIFSELDKEHRQMVLDSIDHRQVIATATEELPFLQEAKVVNLS